MVCSLLAGAGCSLDGEEEVRGQVTGEAKPTSTPPTLLLHNKTNQSVCYFTGELSVMARVDFIFEDCAEAPTIAPGETARVPYEEINYYDEGDARVWVAWRVDGHTDRGGGSFKVSLQ